MKTLLLLASLAAAAPLFAQTPASSVTPEPASGVAWGTPASAAAPGAAASGAAKSPQSAFATARATSSATGEYFHDFGELIVRVRSVKWIAEICSEAFPEERDVNEHAYQDWLIDHGDFVAEMEGQFAVIEKYWAESSPHAKKEGFTADELRARVDANREGLKQEFRARGRASFQRRCEAYPEILVSPQLYLERSQADYVTSVRMGPR